MYENVSDICKIKSNVNILEPFRGSTSVIRIETLPFQLLMSFCTWLYSYLQLVLHDDRSNNTTLISLSVNKYYTVIV